LTTGRQLGAAVIGRTWWLDVETSNTWNGDGKSNTAVLQGMYDYLRSHAVTSDYPLHEAPLWVATGGNSSTARAKCPTSFTGGPTQMVQFIGTDGFGTNAMC